MGSTTQVSIAGSVRRGTALDGGRSLEGEAARSEENFYEQEGPSGASVQYRPSPKARRKITDWKTTTLYAQFSRGDLSFPREVGGRELFNEEEAEYVYEMMKNRFSDFKRSKMTRPFFVKALDTLQVLMSEVNNDHLYRKLCGAYSETSSQNTFKLVIRCRIYFSARALLFALFEQIASFKVGD